MDKIALIALGADPEVMLLTAKGTPKSAEGLFGGTKDNPKEMGIGPGFFVQEDNVAAEYNIPPSINAKDFSNNIIKGLAYIRAEAKKHKLKVVLESALHFPEEELATKHCQTLGCDPDYNIWTLAINPRPVPPKTLRTAAGHVHVSWRNPTNQQKIAMVRAMDLFLGVPSILVTKQNERRKLYGAAGAFRDKPYGVEYRTLDNFWLGTEPYRRHIFTQVQAAVHTINMEQEMFMEILEESKEEIINTINYHDRDGALQLMEEFNIAPFPMWEK